MMRRSYGKDPGRKRREMVREAGRHDRWSWPTPESLIEQWVDSSLDQIVSVPRSLRAQFAACEAECPF